MWWRAVSANRPQTPFPHFESPTSPVGLGPRRSASASSPTFFPAGSRSVSAAPPPLTGLLVLGGVGDGVVMVAPEGFIRLSAFGLQRFLRWVGWDQAVAPVPDQVSALGFDQGLTDGEPILRLEELHQGTLHLPVPHSLSDGHRRLDERVYPSPGKCLAHPEEKAGPIVCVQMYNTPSQNRPRILGIVERNRELAVTPGKVEVAINHLDFRVHRSNRRGTRIVEACAGHRTTEPKVEGSNPSGCTGFTTTRSVLSAIPVRESKNPTGC